MKKRRIKIKGEERKQLGIWWREVRKALKGVKCRCIPRFTDVKVYFVPETTSFWGQTERISKGGVVEISEKFLKTFGDKLDVVECVFKHEVLHFICWNHTKRFLELMKILGFQEKHTYQYILRVYSEKFYRDRCETKKGTKNERLQKDYRKGKKLWDF